MKQVKVTLSDKFYKYLKKEADRFDLPPAQFVKYILIKDVQQSTVYSRKIKTTIAEDLDFLNKKIETKDRFT